MITTIIMGIFAVAFPYFYKNVNVQLGLKISFFFIFIFLALRYDFGNDYMEYYKYFSTVHRVSVNYLLNFQEYSTPDLKEFGYTWLNKLFPSFYLMVAFLSLFTCYVYYNAIKSYGTPNFIWFSVFIFIFDPSLMLIQSSAMRQTIAIGLFLYSMKYLIERNFFKYCFIILLGSLFHTSAIILLPIYFFITPVKWNKWILFTIVALYLITTFFGYSFLPSIANIAFQISPSYKEFYMTEIVGSKLGSGLGYLFWSAIFLFIIWSHNENKGEAFNTVISKISLVGFILTPLCMYLNIIGRIGLYFGPVMLLALPYAVSLLKSPYIKMIAVSILILWYIANFYLFFHSPLYTQHYINYKMNIIDGI